MAVAGGSRERRGAMPIFRGHELVELKVSIAKNELTEAQYKRRYGLSPALLQRFVEENADDIAKIAIGLEKATDAAMAGLWVSKKAQRLSEFESDVNDINALINTCRNEDGTLNPVLLALMPENKAYINLIRMKRAMLSSVADEIDGPRRQVVTPEDERSMVRYVIEGDITENLT